MYFAHFLGLLVLNDIFIEIVNWASDCTIISKFKQRIRNLEVFNIDQKEQGSKNGPLWYTMI